MILLLCASAACHAAGKPLPPAQMSTSDHPSETSPPATPYPPDETATLTEAYPGPPPSAASAASTGTLPSPQLGPGKVPVEPLSSAQPAVFTYICPWLEFAGDLPVYSYNVIASYPHDPGAYTQGLVYRQGVMYESTGLYGASSVRIVDLETGQVKLSRELPETYFAEGLALSDGRLFQLTWKEQTGFIYNPENLESTGDFAYSTEGWGLTEDGQRLIMSDGTERLFWLDAHDQSVTASVQVSSQGRPVTQLNELEYVNGEVWANVYQTSCIARIDPGSGRVTGWIDISGLLSPEELVSAEVPNGIAYDPLRRRLFVTGKFWPRLFEIEITPAHASSN